jgi:type I restriction-modification system DNA methylase subunit
MNLINLSKQAADLIRTRVDYTFILLLLFYKAYSDKWQKEFEEKIKKLRDWGWSEDEAIKEASSHYHTLNFTCPIILNYLFYYVFPIRPKIKPLTYKLRPPNSSP